MKHNKIREMLPDFIQGRLSKEDADLVRQLLPQSESLRNEYNELRSYFSTITTLKPIKAPGNFLTSVHDRITRQTPITKFFKTLFFPFHIKLPLELAGAALTAFLVIVIFNPYKKGTIPTVVFDESSMQTKNDVIDKRKLEAEAAIPQDDKPVEPVEENKNKPVLRSNIPIKKAPRPRKKAVSSAPPSQVKQENRYNKKKKDISGLLGNNAQSNGVKAAAPTAGYDKKEEMNQETALASRTLSKPPTSMMNDLPEGDRYVEEIFERKDSIVQLTQPSKSIPLDIGLIALSIAGDKSSDKEEMEYQRAQSRSKRKKRYLAQKESSAAAPSARIKDAMKDLKPSSMNYVIFAQIESIITSYEGNYTLIKDKSPTLEKRHYKIKIHPENFPPLKKALEGQGIVTDKDLSLIAEKPALVTFHLVIHIE